MHVVINDDLDRATDELVGIVRSAITRLWAKSDSRLVNSMLLPVSIPTRRGSGTTPWVSGCLNRSRRVPV